MVRRNTAAAVAMSAMAGTVLWYATAMLNGRREAWDGAGYWTIAYPLAIAACAWLGYRHPSHPWRWAGVLFLSQFVAMCLRNGELGSLWPLGMVMFAVIAVPGVVAATVAARRNTGGRRSTS